MVEIQNYLYDHDVIVGNDSRQFGYHRHPEGNRLNRSEGGEVERWRDVFETIHFRLYAYASQCEA
jgi:hypothetical protein